MEYTYFAKINNDSKVVELVTLIENKFILDEDSNVSIDLGFQHLRKTFEDYDNFLWLNLTESRGICNVDSIYLPQHDKFVDKKLFNSWILNEETFRWDPPIPIPQDSNSQSKAYIWVEEIGNWVSKTITPE
jgi:hypothetical protein